MCKTNLIIVLIIAICSNCTNSNKTVQDKATSEDYKILNSTFYHLVKNVSDTSNREFGYSNFIKSFDKIPSKYILRTFLVNSLGYDSTLNENEVFNLSNGNIKVNQIELLNRKKIRLNTKYIINIGYRRIIPIKNFSERYKTDDFWRNEIISFSRIIYNGNKDKAFFKIEYIKCGSESFGKVVYVEKINGIWIIKKEKIIHYEIS